MKKIIKITEMKKRRIQLGISQSSMAGSLGLATSTVGGYERGDNPVSKKSQERISSILKCSVEKLFKNNLAI
jgi:transcriptional regulator with XRE-family HTH domain